MNRRILNAKNIHTIIHSEDKSVSVPLWISSPDKKAGIE
jgi:hypothetical protein